MNKKRAYWLFLSAIFGLTLQTQSYAGDCNDPSFWNQLNLACGPERNYPECKHTDFQFGSVSYCLDVTQGGVTLKKYWMIRCDAIVCYCDSGPGNDPCDPNYTWPGNGGGGGGGEPDGDG